MRPAFSSPRRWAFRTGIALALCLGTAVARADSAPMRIVIGFPPGATMDVVARLLAEKLRHKLGRTVIVENKAGAGGAIANEVVKNANADGTTMLIAPVTTLTMYPHSHPDLRYDPFKDFTPVVHIARFPYALGVGNAVPAKTLAEYAQVTKANPQHGFFGSAGVGSATHYFGLMYAKASGAQLTHVPYAGTSAVLMAVQSGQLPGGFVPLADMASVSRSGKARLLALVSGERNPAFPDVPTFKELGYPITDEGQYAMYAPAKTPQPVIDKVADAVRGALKDGEVKARFDAAFLTPTGHDGKYVTSVMKQGYDAWGPVIRSSGFKLDQ